MLHTDDYALVYREPWICLIDILRYHEHVVYADANEQKGQQIVNAGLFISENEG